MNEPELHKTKCMNLINTMLSKNNPDTKLL